MRCIFCFESEPPTGFTEEHVFPQAVGGTLVVPFVCKACNDRLGHSVDSTVTGHTLVALKRHLLGIPGKSGAIPNPLERAAMEDDPTHKVRLDLTKPLSRRIYTVPFVQRTMAEPGKGTVSARIDATDAHRLGDIINTTLRRIGAPPVTDDVINELSSVVRTDQPQLSIPLSFDLSEYRRGLMKIVYELACHWMGETYADDPVAAFLRSFILDADLPLDRSNRYPIRATMRMAPEEPFLPFWPTERDHLMGCLIRTGGRLAIQISVLGVLDAIVTVTDSQEMYPSCQQRFVCINPQTGAKRESTFEEEVGHICDNPGGVNDES